MSSHPLFDDEDDFADCSIASGDDDSYPGDEPSNHTTTLSISHTHDSSHAERSMIEDQLSKKQSRAVLRLRLLVLLLLMVFAMVVSIAVFVVTFGDNAEAFEHDFTQVAKILIDSFEADVIRDVGAISALVVSTSTSGGSKSNNSNNWPFETFPNFVQQARRARHETGILSVSIAPLVTAEQFEAWDDFVLADENTYWMDEDLQYQEEKGINNFEHPDNIYKSKLTQSRKIDPMHYFDESGHAIKQENTSPFYLPIFQMDPVLQTSVVNENMLQTQTNTSSNLPPEVALVVFEEQHALLGDFLSAPPGTVDDLNTNTAMFATLQSMAAGEEVEYLGDPNVAFYIPVFDHNDSSSSSAPEKRKTVAVLTVTVNWGSYFTNRLSDCFSAITVVLSNTCYDDASTAGNSSSFTYEIKGLDAKMVGYGDHHDETMDEYRKTGVFSKDTLDDGTVSGIHLLQGCQHQVDVYPTKPFLESYKTNTPIVITMSTVVAFILIIFLFLFYDRMVEARQRHVLSKATQSAALVSSLFPKGVGEKLMQTTNNLKPPGFTNKRKLLSDAHDHKVDTDSTPIADLYMNCTVCFMDIAGFTAWSSTREPAQVFTLLQSIYGAFDDLAKRRRVFKVETIGDSYMAVTGLPDPLKNHAVIMVRFSQDCLIKMKQVVKELEGSLGPDTADLSMRVGLNSGPVTAGVLRGQRTRYQLFGDSVNTASRMESTGVPGKIQVSATTAELLRKEGKGHWVKAREDTVNAKGKGELHTFWARPATRSESTTSSGNSTECHRNDSMGEVPEFKPVNERLVKWMVAMLVDDIKKIVQGRSKGQKNNGDGPKLVYHRMDGATPIDEVRETIEMPAFNPEVLPDGNKSKKSPSDVDVQASILEDLTRYVQAVASRYRNNAFHSFDHACHVTMSVKKLLGRIVAPDDSTPEEQYEMTYGIKSDPLASLAMTFSALIHDVDHHGISNTQLGKEQPELAGKYRGKSVAEQNSVDIAWEILMEDQYQSLRSYIFGTQAEMMRFRQLVVNIVLATDIFDKELNDLRKARWTKAFSGDTTWRDGSKHKAQDTTSLRATIVFEHLIQASDVSHTMQHWHVYQKWNKRLFTEMFRAYQAGRMEKDPSEFWYNGELGFLDNYVIPLAKKMKDCGVFGVSSDEYLSYAMQNRMEWEARGKGVVEEVKQQLLES